MGSQQNIKLSRIFVVLAPLGAALALASTIVNIIETTTLKVSTASRKYSLEKLIGS
jgi:hypothetical protein